MKLNSFALAAAIFVMLFGGIGFAGVMNWWQTETTKVPAAFTEGTFAGQYNPADIRGSYTFGDISELFGVPLAELQSAFRMPEDVDPAAYQVKSLEEQFADLPVEMGTGAVRMFVAFYKGLPFEVSTEEETYLFVEAADILRSHGAMRPEQAAYLEDHILVEEAAAPIAPPETSQPAVEPTEHAAAEYKVNGNTTFQDLLDWGVTRDAVEAVLGEPIPSPKMVIKDYASQKGETFSTLKTRLQAEVDKQK